jgi:hypothetical protein
LQGDSDTVNLSTKKADLCYINMYINVRYPCIFHEVREICRLKIIILF